MRFQIIDCEQRTPEWFAARLGRLTGSRAGDMLAKIKSGEAAARRNLRVDLSLEMITGKAQEDDFISFDMKRGMELEPIALGEFELRTGKIVQRTGFLSFEDDFGCSLDGHVDNFEEIIEVKCPKPAIHLSYLRLNGMLPADYIDQCRHNTWISDAKWLNFVSYNEDFPPELQLYHTRVHRDTLYIPEYEQAARKFMKEVRAEADSIRAMVCAAA